MPDWQIQLNLKIHPFIEVIIANLIVYDKGYG